MNAGQTLTIAEIVAQELEVEVALLRAVKNMVENNCFPQPRHGPHPPCPVIRELLEWQLRQWHVDDLLHQIEGECGEPMLLGPRVQEATKSLIFSLLAVGIWTSIPEAMDVVKSGKLSS